MLLAFLVGSVVKGITPLSKTATLDRRESYLSNNGPTQIDPVVRASV